MGRPHVPVIARGEVAPVIELLCTPMPWAFRHPETVGAWAECRPNQTKPNQTPHEWRIPSSKGEHVCTRGSIDWHTGSAFMVSPPSPGSDKRFLLGGGGWHKASVLGCLCLAAPIGLSPLLILTLCGCERILVVSTEPLDDLSCLTTPGSAVPGGGGGRINFCKKIGNFGAIFGYTKPRVSDA